MQDAIQPDSKITSVFGQVWRWGKRISIFATIFGLATFNVLSLVSETVHAAGYNFVHSLLSTVASNAVTEGLLKQSPTVKRKSDVIVATKRLSDEKAAVELSKKSLEIKHAGLEKTHGELTHKHAELSHLSAQRSAVTQKVSQRLGKRAILGATRNASSVFAESIPYLGIGVVLGVTALDLKDACDTVKDINELNAAYGHPVDDASKVCGLKVPTKTEVWEGTKNRWLSVKAAAVNALKSEGVDAE